MALLETCVADVGVRFQPRHPFLEERTAVLDGRRIADDALSSERQ